MRRARLKDRDLLPKVKRQARDKPPRKDLRKPKYRRKKDPTRAKDKDRRDELGRIRKRTSGKIYKVYVGKKVFEAVKPRGMAFTTAIKTLITRISKALERFEFDTSTTVKLNEFLDLLRDRGRYYERVAVFPTSSELILNRLKEKVRRKRKFGEKDDKIQLFSVSCHERFHAEAYYSISRTVPGKCRRRLDFLGNKILGDEYDEIPTKESGEDKNREEFWAGVYETIMLWSKVGADNDLVESIDALFKYVGYSSMHPTVKRFLSTNGAAKRFLEILDEED